MNKLTAMMVTLTLLWGCGSMVSAVNPLPVFTSTDIDMSKSTGEGQARIEGLSGFWVNCGIVKPVRADSLTVDAGRVKIQAYCSEDDPFDTIPFTRYVMFNFIAEDGHTYALAPQGSDWIRGSDYCLGLLDVTAGGHIVACEPYYSGSNLDDLSTGDDTAIIKAGGASSDKGNCRPSTGGRRGRRDFLRVNAGPITIDGECHARILPDIFGLRRRMSSFEFVAEAGHTYTLTASDNECMSLLDITSEEIVIACEPYGKSK